MTGSETRKALIDAGLRGLLANGYDGIGIGPILAAAGVPKGSFYHFFPSKEAFACAVLEAYAAGYRARLAGLLQAPDVPPRQRLEAYFAALEADLRGAEPMGGCLFGVIAQTMAARNAALRATLQDCFATWQANLRQVLVEAEAACALAPGITGDEAAAFLIDAYEGALVRMKADGGFAPLARFRTYALDRLFRAPP